MSSAKIRLLLILLVCSVATATRGDEESASASDENAEVTTLTGVFEAVKKYELAADTKHIKSLKIKKLVPHGTLVTKDENLVWFETSDIDKQIREAQSSLRLSQVNFKDEEFAYENLLDTQKLDKASADRTFQKSKTDFDNFVQVDRQRQIDAAHFDLKNSQASLDNAVEELTQLEQMYKEDDLTEESEEIVLKRAKQAVENAEFRLKGTEISTERTLKQVIPRSQAEQEDAMARAQLLYDKAIHDLHTARRKRELELEQKRDKLKQDQDDLNELRDERKRLVIQAPDVGVVFHGKLIRGKVNEKPSTLDVGSSATGGQVLITLAVPNELQIRVDLQEKDLQRVRVGLQGTVTVTAYPDRRMTATVKSISPVPYAGAKFDCVLSVKLPKAEPAIMPGMTCTIELDAEDGATDKN